MWDMSWGQMGLDVVQEVLGKDSAFKLINQ